MLWEKYLVSGLDCGEVLGRFRLIWQIQNDRIRSVLADLRAENPYRTCEKPLVYLEIKH